MATCPYCYGALTENHKCPKSRIGRRLGDAFLTVLLGAGIAVGLCYGVVEQPTVALVFASAALGAVLANAVRQALGGPRA